MGGMIVILGYVEWILGRWGPREANARNPAPPAGKKSVQALTGTRVAYPWQRVWRGDRSVRGQPAAVRREGEDKKRGYRKEEGGDFGGRPQRYTGDN